jgi:hypothetical protein
MTCRSDPLAQQIQRIYEHDITAYFILAMFSLVARCSYNEDANPLMLLITRRRNRRLGRHRRAVSPGYDEMQRLRQRSGVLWKRTTPTAAKAGRAGETASEPTALYQTVMIDPPTTTSS